MSTQPSSNQASSSGRARIGRWVWFAAWVTVGAGYALSFTEATSIGLFMLPLPVFVTILLARKRSTHGGLPGLISGFGVPLLHVAYLNRSGPGLKCNMPAGGGQYCSNEGSPWPWLTVSVFLLVVGVATFIARQRHLPRQ